LKMLDNLGKYSSTCFLAEYLSSKLLGSDSIGIRPIVVTDSVLFCIIQPLSQSTRLLKRQASIRRIDRIFQADQERDQRLTNVHSDSAIDRIKLVRYFSWIICHCLSGPSCFLIFLEAKLIPCCYLSCCCSFLE